MTNDTPNLRHDVPMVEEAAPPWCPECRSADHLLLELITGTPNGAVTAVDVEYTCIECDIFYAHPVSVEGLARFTDRVQTPVDPSPAPAVKTTGAHQKDLPA